MTSPRTSRTTARNLPDACTSSALAAILSAVIEQGCEHLLADEHQSALHEPSVNAARAFARQLRTYTAPDEAA